MENTIDNIHTWADRTISYWRSKNIPLQRGASLELISKTEKIIGFTFPNSFRVLYQKANGFEDFDWDENMICIWSLTRIEKEFGWYPNFIGFADFLINSHVYGFLKDQNGIFKNYDFAERRTPEKIAKIFDEAIDLINMNSDVLY